VESKINKGRLRSQKEAVPQFAAGHLHISVRRKNLLKGREHGTKGGHYDALSIPPEVLYRAVAVARKSSVNVPKARWHDRQRGPS